MRKAILSLLLICLAIIARAQAGIETGTVGTQGTNFRANYVNRTGTTMTFDYGVGILTSEGYLVPLAYATATDAAPEESTGSLPFDVASALKGRQGIHRLVPIARLGQTAPWFITIAPKESYVEAKVENGVVSLSNKRNDDVAFSLLVPTLTFTPTPTADQPTTMSIKVQNMGNTPFVGELYLLATYTGQIHKKPLSLAAGSTDEYSIAYTPTTGGKITFSLSLDEKGEKTVFAVTIDVNGENRQASAMYWTAGAKQPQTIQTVGKLTIPSDALAVYTEMPDALSPDATQPNRLYFFPGDALVSTEFDNYNTVIGNRAERIVLVDGYPFYTPKTFTATAITYQRTVKKTSDGQTSGWETIVLPFDVNEVLDKTTGKTLLWHKTETDNGKFWLRKLDKVEANVCHLSPVVDEMLSYTPYLLAFPHASSAEETLAGHTLEWSTFEAEIYPDITLTEQVGNYEVYGAFTNEPLPAATYVLNDNGTAFEQQPNATAAPFHAAILSQASSDASRLTITAPAIPAGIETLHYKGTEHNNPRYSVDGYRINGKAKGIVIVGGKKILSNEQ